MWIELHVPDKPTFSTAAYPNACPGQYAGKIINIVPAGVVRSEVYSFITACYSHINNIYVWTLPLYQEWRLPGILGTVTVCGQIRDLP